MGEIKKNIEKENEKKNLDWDGGQGTYRKKEAIKGNGEEDERRKGRPKKEREDGLAIDERINGNVMTGCLLVKKGWSENDHRGGNMKCVW